MKIELLDNNKVSKGFLKDDYETLENLGLKDGMHLDVSDPNASILFDQDPSEDQIFQLSDEQYAEREDSILAWKKRNKLGRFREVDLKEQKRLEEEMSRKAKEELEQVNKLTLKSRCEVRVPNHPSKRGVIEFVGETKFKPGYWVGVHYDEPVGKNNGSIEGVSYFQCPDKYGGFVRPAHVEAGDFPELGLDDLDEF